ncbi:MAG TPA: hypothetical protein VHI13_11880 [Candidatus Kapabacteria bacterium]|nr:hypothetical protein [Candidatus Kapabacteria bacterium]
MSPALVMILWTGVAVTAGIVLGGIAFFGGIVPDRLRTRCAIFRGSAPLVCLAWMPMAFMLYWAWAWSTDLETQVGATDYWTVRLPNNYELTFVDLDTSASLTNGSDIPPAMNVTQVGVSGGLIFGRADGDGFVLNSATGELEHGPEREIFARHGLDSLQLRGARDFTMGREPTILDSMILVQLILGIPIGVLNGVWRSYCREPAPGDERGTDSSWRERSN